MGALSPWHWLLVLLIVLLIFGPSRLPEAGKGLGKAIRGFREGLKGDGDEAQSPSAEKTPEDKAPQSDTQPKA